MRAILLAAGMGTRLRPLTLTTPKPLIPINGRPMIEIQIEYLIEVGIDEIIVVTGYLREKFDYLKDKYGVKLIYNDKFNYYNNIYTMYLVKKYLPDSYVIDTDNYFKRNFLISNPQKSMYFSAKKEKFQNEWVIVYDEDYRINEIKICDGVEKHILCGISYWSKKDGEYIVGKLEEAIESGTYTEMYWDDIVRNNISNLDVYLQEIEPDDSYEIDSIEDYNRVLDQLENTYKIENYLDRRGPLSVTQGRSMIEL